MKNKIKFVCYVLFFVLLLLSIKTMMPKVISEVYPTFAFSDGRITETIEGFGYEIDTSSLTPTLKINNGGTYIVKGSSKEGSIVIDKGIRNVKIVLEDFSLESSNTAPIIIGKESRVSIQIVGTSTLTDNENPENETSTDPLLADAYEGAAIKMKSGATLKLFGTGVLNIEGNSKNGIKGSTGTILEVNSGTYNITSENDGISMDNSIIIRNGLFHIDSMRDGIESGGEITIENGEFHITTFTGYNTNGFDSETMSAKALKATGREIVGDLINSITITGGTFYLDSKDDAIHSDGIIDIIGGTFEIYSGDDAIHADANLTIGKDSSKERDPEITIVSNFEGIEGGNIFIYNGKIKVTAVDDAVNSKGIFINNRKTGGNIKVYGGQLYLDSTDQDGLDSNNDIILSGGEIIIFSSPKGTDNSSLDPDRYLIIDGATVFAAGTNFMNVKPTYGSQPYVEEKTTRPAGATVKVTMNNELVYTDTLHRESDYIIYSSPNFQTGTIENGDLVTCKNSSFDREWTEEMIENPSLTEEGKMKYTSNCGEIEYKTIPKLTPEETDEVPEQFTITFDTDDYSHVNVYYTQDLSDPNEEDVTSTIARNVDRQEPLGDGTDQVNFCITIDDPYELKSVTTNNNNYNQLKTLNNNCYRMTKVNGNVTVIIKSTAITEEIVTVKTPQKTRIIGENIFEKIEYTKTFTYLDFMNSVDILSNSITVKNANNKTVTSDTATLATKSKLLLETKDYTIIVEGDVNQDGKISSADYVAIKNHIMETKKITDSSLFLAADMNQDNRISSLDYITIKKIIMGEM